MDACRRLHSGHETGDINT